MSDAVKWGIYQDILVQQNTDYTFSIDVSKTLWMECRALTTTTSADGTITPTGIVSDSGWDEVINSNDYNYDNRRFARTFNTGNYRAYRFFFYGYYAINGQYMNKAGQINHPQLELGTKATDWTPSPLDSQEKIDTKASHNDVASVIARGATSENNLLNNTDLSENWFYSLPIVDQPTTSFNGWSIFNIPEDDDLFEDSGDMWTMEMNNIEEEFFGFVGAYQGSDVGEYDGEVRYGNSYLYQDVELEENTSYTFSIYAFLDDYVISPLVQCVAIDEDGEEIPNTGWNSKDFTWSQINTENERIKRLYKTFSSGSNTLWRIKFYGKAEWDESAQVWECYSFYYGMNKIQLNKGTSATTYQLDYQSLLTLQSSVKELQRNTENDENEIRNINNILRGKKNKSNLLKYSYWTYDTIFLPAVPSEFRSVGQWTRTVGIAKETWDRDIASSYYTEEWSNTYIADKYRYYEYQLPSYSYDSSGETHSEGDSVLLNGGIYQDVTLEANTNYTFAMTLLYPSDTSQPTGGFVDCKAITGSSPNYTTVPNTGFDIQEWEHFSGTKTWDVNNNGLGSSRAKLVRINFNTGNYTKYRFRIYGAVYWTSASTTKNYGGHINFFSLKKNEYYPTGNIPSGNWYTDNWEFGREYGIQHIYAKIENQRGTSTLVNSLFSNNTLDIYGQNHYTTSTPISLGTVVASAILTNGSSQLIFTIPTGRVFPSGTTISKITGTLLARGTNHNSGGYYICKSASGGYSGASFDSSTTFTFYNANNQSKTLASSKMYISLEGGTNVLVNLSSGSATDYLFSGTSTINGYINNQAATVYFQNVTLYLNIPTS